MNDRYYMKRVVSWVAYHVRRGADLPGVLAANAKRHPPFDDALLREAYSTACSAVRNAELINQCDPHTRLCDIPGVRIPPGA